MKRFSLLFVTFLVSQFVFGQEFLPNDDKWVLKATKKLFKETLDAAEKGDAQSQYYMGNLYSNGEVLKPNYNQACYWYKKSCDNGYFMAFISLGNLYEENFKSSINFHTLENAVKKRDKDALSKIGSSTEEIENLYLKGIECSVSSSEKNLLFDKLYKFLDFRIGVLDNFDNIYQEDEDSRAIEICKSASEKGSSEANFILGVYYRKYKQYSKAKHYYLLSADKGYALAQFDLGSMYYAGSEISQNLDEAFKYLRMFALNSDYTFDMEEDDDEWKDGTRLHYLATCYRYGKGTLKNAEVANLWDALAALYDSNDAYDYICDLANKRLEEKELSVFVYQLFASYIAKNNIQSRSAKFIIAQYNSLLGTPKNSKVALDTYLELKTKHALSQLDLFTVYQSLALYYQGKQDFSNANMYKDKLKNLDIQSSKSTITVGGQEMDIYTPVGVEKWTQDLFVDILRKN